MREALRASPSTLPCGIAVVALLVLAADGGGIRLVAWTPLAFGLLALLAMTAVLLRDGLRDVPGPVLAALGGLAALCAWSYASILWAADRGAAWEGANRTLLALLVASLFGLWRRREGAAAALLAAWAAGTVAVGVLVAARILAADDLAGWFAGDRLVEPAGYANAQAAAWLLALWPCVALAAAPRMPPVVRAALAGGAVLLVDLALLSLSRGAVLALPVTAALFLALAPHRLRHLAVLTPVALGVAASAPLVLDAGPALRAGAGEAAAVREALVAALVAAAAVGALVAAAIPLGRRAVARDVLGPGTGARARRAWAVAAPAALAVGAVAALAVAGDPVARATSAWESFRDGYDARGAAESRLGELGSNRSDFYRVALDAVQEEPLHGVGVDNYQGAYLRLGAARETPRYAHSWPLGLLAQLGVAGALVALAWLAATAWAAATALRRAGGLGTAVAAGAVFGFAGFLVHGAGDWLWEFPSVALPAFALLGMALALVPGRPARSPRAGAALAAGIVVACAAAAASYAAPWAAERELRAAGLQWPGDPRGAFARVDRAARLNPLSAGPYLTGGTIAVRRRTYGVADRYFAAALARNPDAAYAWLQRGAIASALGGRARAEAALRRAVALDPRNEVAGAALRDVVHDVPIDVGQLNAELLARGRSVGTG